MTMTMTTTTTTSSTAADYRDITLISCCIRLEKKVRQEEKKDIAASSDTLDLSLVQCVK